MGNLVREANQHRLLWKKSMRTRARADAKSRRPGNMQQAAQRVARVSWPRQATLTTPLLLNGQIRLGVKNATRFCIIELGAFRAQRRPRAFESQKVPHDVTTAGHLSPREDR